MKRVTFTAVVTAVPDDVAADPKKLDRFLDMVLTYGDRHQGYTLYHHTAGEGSTPPLIEPYEEEE